MRKYRITLDGKTYEMEIELVDAIEADEAIKRIDKSSINTITSSKVSETAVNESNTPEKNIITSPMPGSITKINLAEGKNVTKGQTILVLEAMKMENEITAPRNGKITKLYVCKGQTVQGGEPLFEISD